MGEEFPNASPSDSTSSPATETEAPQGGASTVAAGAFVFTLAVTMVAVATGYNEEARRLPILVGAPVALFAAAEVFGQLRQWRRSLAGGAPAVRRPSSATWVPVAYLMAFVLLFVTLGQSLGTWIFTIGFIRARKALSWRGALIMASALAVSLWGIATILDLRTYGGIFGLPI